jgi:hypothetical protein
MKSIITILALITILCAGCKQSPTNPTSETKEIWPLKIGNYWVMKYTYYDSLGHITQIMIDSITVAQDTLIKNEKVYILINIAGNFTHKILAMNRADGYYEVGIGWDPIFHKDTIFYGLDYKYPGKTGETYTGFQDNNKIITTDTIVHALKDGSFNCYEYYNENVEAGGYYTQYLSPGVGRIYSVKHNRMPGGNIYMEWEAELQSYWVK